MPSDYAVTVTVKDKYWEADILVEDCLSSDAAEVVTRELLDQLPVAGIHGDFVITQVRALGT